MARQNNDDSGEASEIGRDGNQPGQKYLSKRRNGMIVLSIENLHRCAHREVTDGGGHEEEGSVKSDEACSWDLEVHAKNSHQEKERETGEEHNDRSKRSGLGKLVGKRQPSLSIKKVHPMEVTTIDKAGDPDEKKPYAYSERETKNQGSSSKRSNAITNDKKAKKLLKEAWISEEEQEQEQEPNLEACGILPVRTEKSPNLKLPRATESQ